MLTLAFDISSKTASVAILRDQSLIYETIVDKGLNHSEVLLPSIDEACRLSSIRLPEIDLFACTMGPGSFTGLRIGISTLKGLILATGKVAAGVSSLTALALNVDQKEKIIGAMMDAGRGQVYLAYYRYASGGDLIQLSDARAFDPRDVDGHDGEEVIYVGDGAVHYSGIIPALSKDHHTTAPEEQQHIRAGFVGRLALDKYQRNDLLDSATCVPVYLRSADALPGKPILS